MHAWTPFRMFAPQLFESPARVHLLEAARPQGATAGMQQLARKIRRRARDIGVFTFILYVALRGVRVHLFIVDRAVGLLAEYALMLPPLGADLH